MHISFCQNVLTVFFFQLSNIKHPVEHLRWSFFAKIGSSIVDVDWVLNTPLYIVILNLTEHLHYTEHLPYWSFLLVDFASHSETPFSQHAVNKSWFKLYVFIRRQSVRITLLNFFMVTWSMYLKNVRALLKDFRACLLPEVLIRVPLNHDYGWNV